VPIFETGLDGLSHHDVLTEWTVFEHDRGRVDPTSRREAFRVEQPAPPGGIQHNTGEIVFNPHSKAGNDDYGLLYISLGDGAADRSIGISVPRGTPQNLSEVFGKILLIDPLEQEDGASYGVPTNNPFIFYSGAHPEIWALGFRHPQIMSFDIGGDGMLLVGEIGQLNIEEINIALAGRNYGWQVREGTFATDPNDPQVLYESTSPDPGYTPPVAQYDHEDVSGPTGATAVAGGFVYRGADIPELEGQYIFGDLVAGRVFHIPVDQLRIGEQTEIQELTLIQNGQPVNLLDLLGTHRADLRFGQDEKGEIYILTKQDGKIRRLRGYKKNLNP